MHGFELKTLRVAATLLFFIVACGSKVNQNNFDRIEEGMTREAVVAILGEPTAVSDFTYGDPKLYRSGTALQWDDGDRSITVRFVDGKVWIKQFVGVSK